MWFNQIKQQWASDSEKILHAGGTRNWDVHRTINSTNLLVGTLKAVVNRCTPPPPNINKVRSAMGRLSKELNRGLTWREWLLGSQQQKNFLAILEELHHELNRATAYIIKDIL